MLYWAGGWYEPSGCVCTQQFNKQSSVSAALNDIQDTSLLPYTGFSHQQVAVRQRHPTLQTDGGEVRIWQLVAPLTPRHKKTLGEGRAWGRGQSVSGRQRVDKACEAPRMDGLTADCCAYYLLHSGP